MQPKEFLDRAMQAAQEAEHVWPEYAACEAALESGWGDSRLAKQANNLFGQKQGFTTGGVATITLPTREFLHGEWVVVDAIWPKFESWTDSFRARMELLRRKATYASALACVTGEDFVREVSKVWATDPKRADKVLQIHARYFAVNKA